MAPTIGLQNCDLFTALVSLSMREVKGRLLTDVRYVGTNTTKMCVSRLATQLPVSAGRVFTHD